MTESIDQLIDDIYDGQDIAYQECDMSFEEVLSLEEAMEILECQFGNDDYAIN